jgi:hypothetical protein
MGGSLDPSSAGLSVSVSRRAAGSTASTLPATFCPSLNFLWAFLVPRSDMCSVGTMALQRQGEAKRARMGAARSRATPLQASWQSWQSVLQGE